MGLQQRSGELVNELFQELGTGFWQEVRMAKTVKMVEMVKLVMVVKMVMVVKAVMLVKRL